MTGVFRYASFPYIFRNIKNGANEQCKNVMFVAKFDIHKSRTQKSFSACSTSCFLQNARGTLALQGCSSATLWHKGYFKFYVDRGR